MAISKSCYDPPRQRRPYYRLNYGRSGRKVKEEEHQVYRELRPKLNASITNEKDISTLLHQKYGEQAPIKMEAYLNLIDSGVDPSRLKISATMQQAIKEQIKDNLARTKALASKYSQSGDKATKEYWSQKLNIAELNAGSRKPYKHDFVVIKTVSAYQDQLEERAGIAHTYSVRQKPEFVKVKFQPPKPRSVSTVAAVQRKSRLSAGRICVRLVNPKQIPEQQLTAVDLVLTPPLSSQQSQKHNRPSRRSSCQAIVKIAEQPSENSNDDYYQKKQSLFQTMGLSQGTIYSEHEKRASLKAIDRFMNEITFSVKGSKSQKQLRVDLKRSDEIILEQDSPRQETFTLKPQLFDFQPTPVAGKVQIKNRLKSYQDMFRPRTALKVQIRKNKDLTTEGLRLAVQ